MTVAGTKQKVRRLSMTDERLKIVKYINDPVYGGIGITQLELDLISTPCLLYTSDAADDS